MTPIIPITRLPHAEGIPLPAYETALAAGMDLRAAVPDHEPLILKPMSRAMVPTGLAFAVPAGFEAQVRPRSGLAAKAGITCLNTPGTIDADYRGEVKVILINLGEEDFVIRRGDRIAQLVIAPVASATWREVESLETTERGAGGFGSTGAA
ncbi:MAG: dUTP diphosphatase [Parvibaculum sp.]|uniref:dUTP diphosphatase n=1 Tax=Parvibaculum sp. TaxID=2024848 RepID=UPI00272FEFBE|nr:dUTP diphosphatase [Parvibaculum sp.]MDP2151344.1 dUTP diphosphatase [Parvibaculum sp.]